MKLCRHQRYRVIDDIKAPRYHDNKILISVAKVYEDIEHYIVRFSDESPKKEHGWFYMSGKDIRRYGKQKNGRGEVYVVPLGKKQTFTPDKECNCMNMELSLDK